MLPLLLYDIVFIILQVVFYGGALLPAGRLLLWVFGQWGWLGVAFGAPLAYLVFLLTLVLILGLVRLLLPRPRPGHYATPISAGLVVWLLHLTLQRFVNNGLIKDSLFYLNGLRALYLWLMGARVHPAANISGNVNLMDLALLEVGKGSIIGSGVAIFGHYMVGGKLVLAKNRIGRQVVLGAFSKISPGFTAGDKVFIGAACNIGPEVTIGEGARVNAGTDLPPHTTIAPGETWGGRPGRRLEREPADASAAPEPDAQP